MDNVTSEDTVSNPYFFKGSTVLQVLMAHNDEPSSHTKRALASFSTSALTRTPVRSLMPIPPQAVVA